MMDFCKLLEEYDLGAFVNASRMSAGFANENYKLQTTAGVYLCRVCLQQSLANIDYELGILSILKEADFPTAYPIARCDGSFVSFDKETPVVIYQFVEGGEPEVNLNTARQAGSVLADLAAVSSPKVMGRSNSLGWESCESLMRRMNVAKNPDPVLFDFYRTETLALRDAYMADLPKGLVHGDLFTDNTIFEKGVLRAVIDFEEACYENLLFDLGVGINGFCFRDNVLDSGLLNALLNAYMRKRPLTETEKSFLPDYIRRGAHTMITWHLLNDLVDRPEAKQKLRVDELCERLVRLKEFNFQDIF